MNECINDGANERATDRVIVAALTVGNLLLLLPTAFAVTQSLPHARFSRTALVLPVARKFPARTITFLLAFLVYC